MKSWSPRKLHFVLSGFERRPLLAVRRPGGGQLSTGCVALLAVMALAATLAEAPPASATLMHVVIVCTAGPGQAPPVPQALQPLPKGCVVTRSRPATTDRSVRTGGDGPGPVPSVQDGGNLTGGWCSRAQPGSPELPTSIVQNGESLKFRNEYNSASSGHTGPGEVVADQWAGGLHARVSPDNLYLYWQNGSIWRRSAECQH